MENSDKPICLKIWEMRPIRGTCRASTVLMSPIPAITSNSTLSDTFEVVLGASCPHAVDTQRGVELKAERYSQGVRLNCEFAVFVLALRC